MRPSRALAICQFREATGAYTPDNLIPSNLEPLYISPLPRRVKPLLTPHTSQLPQRPHVQYLLLLNGSNGAAAVEAQRDARAVVELVRRNLPCAQRVYPAGRSSSSAPVSAFIALTSGINACGGVRSSGTTSLNSHRGLRSSSPSSYRASD